MEENVKVCVSEAYTRLHGKYVGNVLSLSSGRINMRVDGGSSFQTMLAILMYDKYIYHTPISMHTNL